MAFTSSASANGRYPAAGQIAIDPGAPHHIVVRTTFGLLQSFDGGASWTWICEQAISSAGFEDPELIIRPGGRLDLGVPDGLAVGDPTGCDWTRTPALVDVDVIDLVQNLSTPATAFAVSAVTVGGAFNAVMAATGSNDVWTLIGEPRANSYPLTIESAPSRSQRLYVGAENGDLDAGFVDVSDDAGLTWTRHDNPDGLIAAYVSGVDPHDPDRVYLRSYYPAGNLYVSDDAAVTWSLIASSVAPLTGFAISPDGSQVAIGGSTGLRVLARDQGDAGSTYVDVRDRPTPVTCLTWTAAGLYACGDEATVGFSVGLSLDGGDTFQPLLHLAQVRPAACPGDSSAALCADGWCATAAAIGAACTIDASVDAGRDTATDSRADNADSGDGSMGRNSGCACVAADSRRTRGSAALGVLLAIATARRRRASVTPSNEG